MENLDISNEIIGNPTKITRVSDIFILYSVSAKKNLIKS